MCNVGLYKSLGLSYAGPGTDMGRLVVRAVSVVHGSK